MRKILTHSDLHIPHSRLLKEEIMSIVMKPEAKISDLMNTVNRLTSSPRQAKVIEYTTYYEIMNNKLSSVNQSNHSQIKKEIEAENQRAAESKVSDVDLASQLTVLTGRMIQRNTNIALIAQTNLMRYGVLRLLG